MTQSTEAHTQPRLPDDEVGSVEEHARAFEARVHDQGVGALEDESTATSVNGAMAHGPHANAMAVNAAQGAGEGRNERDRQWWLRYLASHIAWLDGQIAEIDTALSALDRLEAELAAGTFDPDNPTDEQRDLMTEAGLRAGDFEGRDGEEVIRERREELEREREDYVERRARAEDVARDLEAGDPTAIPRAQEFMQDTDDPALRDRVGSLTQALDQADSAQAQDDAIDGLGLSQQDTALAQDGRAQDDLAVWSAGSFANSISESPIAAAPAGTAFRSAALPPASTAAETPAMESDMEHDTSRKTPQAAPS